MAVAQPVVPAMQQQSIFNRPRGDAALGVLLGIGGGLAQGGILHSSLMNAALLGAGFGLFLGLFFAKGLGFAIPILLG